MERKSNIILTSYFTSSPHPQRIDPNTLGLDSRGYVSPNSPSYINAWCESINNKNLNGIIFHDNLDKDFISSFSSNSIKFKRVPTPLDWSTNDARFFFYRDYLAKNECENVFMTDVCDVTVSQDPFASKEYDCSSIFFGKDVSGLSLKDYQLCALDGTFFDLHAQVGWGDSVLLQISNPPLLNAGVIGGHSKNILPLLDSFCEEREKIGESHLNLNMPIMNYIARTKFSNKIKFGSPVTSEFKKYQSNRDDVWFIHK